MRRLLATCRPALLSGAMVLSLGGCAEDGVECAAVMTYADTVVTVSAVRDHTGRGVDRVVLTAVELDGRPMLDDLRSDVDRRRPVAPGTGSSDTNRWFGLEIGPGGGLVCSVPCGFGTQVGELRLEVTSASGARATREVAADYSRRSRGCGGALKDGTEVELELGSPA